MKQAVALGEELSCFVEAIYCSSDVNSLDGVLLCGNGIRIGFVDGTAPHEFEPRYPGAVEELLNLGDSWERSSLEEQKNEIVRLNRKKTKAYSEAYEKLKISFIFHSKIMAEIKNSFDFRKCKKDIFDIIPKEQDENYTEKIRLVSAFSRLGFTSLNTVYDISDKVLKVGGDKYSRACFMNTLRSALSLGGVSHTSLLSPYNTDDTEAVYIPTSGLGIIPSDGTCEIRADLYCADFSQEKFKEYCGPENAFLDQAKNHLGEASENHFKLEEIYKSAMNFEKNENLTSSVIERCRKILT
jgi:hypothetical protein